MSANAIWYDTDGRFYNDGGIGFGPNEMGRDIIAKLMCGEDTTRLGVTVGYAVEMLRITGRTGNFYDYLDNTADHNFDPTRPTVEEDSHPTERPLAGSFTVPAVKCADPRYGADAIWWDDKANVFNFGGYRVGSAKLGRLLANALMRGEQIVTVGDIDVHADDIVEMARLVGITGEYGLILE